MTIQLQPEFSAGSSQAQRGSGTVLMAGIGAIFLIVLMSLLFFIQSATAGQRAATAADLAALAAADAACGLSAGEPCELAAQVAERAEAKLVSCQLTGSLQDVVEVRTESVILPIGGAATGRARAGPPPDPVVEPQPE